MAASDEPRRVAFVSVDERVIKWGPRLMWRFRADDGSVLTQWTTRSVSPRTNAGRILAALSGGPITPGGSITVNGGELARVTVEENAAGYVRIRAIGGDSGGPLLALDYKRRGGDARDAAIDVSA